MDAVVGYPVEVLLEKMRATELTRAAYNPNARYLKVGALRSRWANVHPAAPGRIRPSVLAAQHRRVLVDWLCEVGEDTRLAMSTVHVAVAYLDAFLQRMEVHRSRLQLVAMAALDLAAKYEEAEERAPSADVLNACANNSYPAGMLHQMAVLILNRCVAAHAGPTPLAVSNETKPPIPPHPLHARPAASAGR